MDLRSKDKSLKFAYFVRKNCNEINNNTLANVVFENVTQFPIQGIINGNLNLHDIQKNVKPQANDFVLESVKIWVELAFHQPLSAITILNQPLCYNSHIRISNRPLTPVDIGNKLKLIKDIFNPNTKSGLRN